MELNTSLFFILKWNVCIDQTVIDYNVKRAAHVHVSNQVGFQCFDVQRQVLQTNRDVKQIKNQKLYEDITL